MTTFDELFAEHNLTPNERKALVMHLATLRAQKTVEALQDCPIASAPSTPPHAVVPMNDADLLELARRKGLAATKTGPHAVHIDFTLEGLRDFVAAIAVVEAVPPPNLLTRAEALHLNAGMPWHQAEEAALSEVGIRDAEIDELIGECAPIGLESIITGEDELRRFARAVLVHGSGISPKAAQEKT